MRGRSSGKTGPPATRGAIMYMYHVSCTCITFLYPLQSITTTT